MNKYVAPFSLSLVELGKLALRLTRIICYEVIEITLNEDFLKKGINAKNVH